jgi:hypothetical protein
MDASTVLSLEATVSFLQAVKMVTRKRIVVDNKRIFFFMLFGFVFIAGIDRNHCLKFKKV